MSKTHPLDEELRTLWSRRSGLDEAGWQRLYELVFEILLSFRPKELAGLEEERVTYVQDFFVDKVFRLDSLSSCQHAGALKVYYQRFLRDRLDTIKRRDAIEVVDFSDDDSDPELTTHTSHQDPISSKEDAWKELDEAGLSIDRVRASAVNLLRAADPWIPAYLALHFCPDAELSEPLFKLSKRLGIKSYHRKAVRLGINWSPPGSGGLGFEQTLIGSWVVNELGLPITPENIDLIHAVFKILCFEALLWAEQQEATS